jgi:hypothetical protein
MPVLKRALYGELPTRDREVVVSVNGFPNARSIRLHFESPNLCIRTTPRWINVGVVAPDWQHGWRDLTDDEYLGDELDLLFHFAYQYVRRGLCVAALGSIALSYKHGIEFYRCRRSNWRRYSTIPEGVDLPRLVRGKGRERSNENRSARQSRAHCWIRLINGLDPYVHRAVFLYIRAVHLIESGAFEEQVVTCLDGITSVASGFVQRVIGAKGEQQRDIAFKTLGMTASQADFLRKLYLIRCAFGGHPSFSNWWDFREIYWDEIEQALDIAQLLIRKLCDLESRHRRFDQRPASWHGWFLEHANDIWEAVGGDQLPG